MKEYFRTSIKGVLLVVVLGSLSWLLAPLIPFINSVILGLLLGILIGNSFKVSSAFESGIQLASTKGLELAILFLSFSINYRHLGALGIRSFVIITFVLFLILVLSRLLARKMKCPGQSGILIGFGTAICGSSAIAALAPQLKANKTETGVAIAVVNLLGTIMMLLLPIALPLFSFSIPEQGLIIGGSLHAVGNVAGAGYSLGPEVGEAAITIKLARIALLSPALFFMHFLLRDKASGGEKIAFKLPWYLIGFLIITIINSLFTLPLPFVHSMQKTGEVLLTFAMVAIGMKVKLRSLLESGKRGILFGIVIFGFMLFTLLSLILIFQG